MSFQGHNRNLFTIVLIGHYDSRCVSPLKSRKNMPETVFPNPEYCTTPSQEFLLKTRKFTIFPDCVYFVLFVFRWFCFVLQRCAQAFQHMERLRAKLQRVFGIRTQRAEDLPAYLL